MSREPGLYADLPNDAYHAEAEWWSSTQLKRLLPEHYKAGGSRDALDFGSAFHTRTLGTDETIVVIDAATWRGKDAAAAREGAWAEGHIPILADDSRRIDEMVGALHDHARAAELLFTLPGTVEESAFAIDEQGRRHKARFDKRVTGAIVDLKSTSSQPGRDNLAKTVLNYGYDLSAAHYLEVASLCGLDADVFGFVFCEKEEPYRVTVAELDGTFIARGRALREQALRRADNPDAYDGADDFITLACPRWAALYESDVA